MDAIYVVTFGGAGSINGDFTQPVCFPTVEAANEEALRFMKSEGRDLTWSRSTDEERHAHVEMAWASDGIGAIAVWLERLPVQSGSGG